MVLSVITSVSTLFIKLSEGHIINVSIHQCEVRLISREIAVAISGYRAFGRGEFAQWIGVIHAYGGLKSLKGTLSFFGISNQFIVIIMVAANTWER